MMLKAEIMSQKNKYATLEKKYDILEKEYATLKVEKDSIMTILSPEEAKIIEIEIEDTNHFLTINGTESSYPLVVIENSSNDESILEIEDSKHSKLNLAKCLMKKCDKTIVRSLLPNSN